MPTSTDASLALPAFDAAVFERLLTSIRATAPADTQARWLLLEAAHVLGQTQFGPHWRTHVLMLGQAWHEKDVGELAGQAMRLALVPLGHLSGRLPLGNGGRATVSAFAPMPMRPEIAAAIEAARRTAA